MKPALVLLAAGEARRFGRLKQFEPVGPTGEALLDYSIWDALRAGFSSVVIVVRPEIEDAARSHLVERWAGVPLVYSHQHAGARLSGLENIDAGFAVDAHRVSRTSPWGTAHAVLCAAAELKGPFAVANADDFYGEDAWRRASGFFAAAGGSRVLTEAPEGAGTAGDVTDADRPAKRKPGDMGLIAYRLDATLSPFGGVSRAICRVDSDGYVEEIVEALDVRSEEGHVVARAADGEARVVPANAPTSMNLWLLQPPILEQLIVRFNQFLTEEANDPRAEFRLSTELNHLVQDGRVRIVALPTSARWLGVTYAEDVPAARTYIAALVRSGAYPASLGVGALERMG